MDADVALRESSILGREFLTWLWFMSDAGDGLFKDVDGRPFSLAFEKKMSVQGGEGESLETVVVSGPGAEMSEARMGLVQGKKVAKALISMQQDTESWEMQVNADDFAVGGLKTPRIEPDPDADPDALFLEKMYLLEKALGFMDHLFSRFLEIRLSPAWGEERQKVREWIQAAGRG